MEIDHAMGNYWMDFYKNAQNQIAKFWKEV